MLGRAAPLAARDADAMKMNCRFRGMASGTLHLLSVVLLIGCALRAPSALAQGALTPPAGPPAPTMKSLDQIEARIILNAANAPGDATSSYIISTPGSYYLTGNVTGAAGKNG